MNSKPSTTYLSNRSIPRLETALLALGLILSTFRLEAKDPGLPSTVAAGAALTEVYSDPRFFEGPTWDPKTKKLYFTAFPKDQKNTEILRLDAPGRVTVWADKTEGVNGTFLSRNGRLLAAQAFGHRVLKYSFGKKGPSNTQVILSDATLNQPNDICEAPNGNLYFTDPDFKNRRTSAVFLLRPKGELIKLITEMPLPNGIKTSNDGKTLYVGDSHEKLWRSYPIMPNGITGPGRVFFNPETESKADPDGFSIDEHGNLYLSGRGGVWVVNPEGEALGMIPVKEFVSNATFGDVDGKALYLTCDGKVYRLAMTVRGAQFTRP